VPDGLRRIWYGREFGVITFFDNGRPVTPQSVIQLSSNFHNDPTDVTAYGTRWLATAGTILKFEGGKFR
jgi:cellulose synthase/poly-beta-1,6-N-acetylglucosamine synthase-like glycosyltransferase